MTDLGIRRRLFAIQATSLAIVTLGGLAGWGSYTLISKPVDDEATWVSQELNQIAHISFGLLEAIPGTGAYRLAPPSAVASLMQQDVRGLQGFRLRLDESLGSHQLAGKDPTVHRELETIRLLSFQAEVRLEQARRKVLAANARGLPVAETVLEAVTQDPSLAQLRRHGSALTGLYDRLSSRLDALDRRDEQARQLGITIWLLMLALAWGIGLLFSWRTADRILRPLLHLEERMRNPNQLLHQQLELPDLHNAPGEIISLSRSFADLQAQLQRLLSYLESRALSDGLTGLGNRLLFDETLAREWKRGLRSGKPLSLLMLDVDHFKLYNDHYGHLQGDECLRQVGSAIASQARRGSDLVCRYGGEEFVVLLPNTDAEQAAAVAWKIVDSIDALAIEHRTSPVAEWVTASIGVASCLPRPDGKAIDLVERADQALYVRKRQLGRHGVNLALEDSSSVPPPWGDNLPSQSASGSAAAPES